jgi:hypothetical protein
MQCLQSWLDTLKLECNTFHGLCRGGSLLGSLIYGAVIQTMTVGAFDGNEENFKQHGFYRSGSGFEDASRG